MSIAQRHYRTLDGTTISVAIEAPVEHPGYWVAVLTFTIDGVADRRELHGLDSLQALHHALAMARADLAYFARSRGITWDGGDDHGLPSFGPD